MGRVCVIYGGQEKFTLPFVGKTERKKTTWKILKKKWEG
jgi:hypothetical protein